MSEEKHVLGPRAKDLTGRQFARLTVVEFAGRRGRRILWFCRCECSNERVVTGENLVSGHSRSCGCSIKGRPARNAIDLTGQRFGRWTVLSFDGVRERRRTYWKCLCDCGSTASILGDNLRGGKSISCGCFRIDHISEIKFKHGHAIKGDVTKEYKAWSKLKARCLDENGKDYPRYGGRGITVCERWRESFENFYADIGPKPSNKRSIDRIDNDGHYSCGKCDECTISGWPANVRWATDTEQARNKSNTRFIDFDGQSICLSEWSEKTGMRSSVILHRLKRGWSVEASLSKPPRHQIRKKR